MERKIRKLNIQVLVIFTLLFASISLFPTNQNSVSAQYFPRFDVYTFEETQVIGWSWPLGEEVTLTIDDPKNGVGVDYTATSTVIVYADFPEDTSAEFSLEDLPFDLESGQLYTMSHGDVTKVHEMRYITIDKVDHVNDTVAGFADVGQEVIINIYNNEILPLRKAVADEEGYWEVDFSIPQNGEEVYDLHPGEGAHAMVYDDDGDGTGAKFRIPNPVVYARANDDQIEGWDWPIGDMVTIFVDDPATTPNPDYTKEVLVEIVEGDPHSFLFYTDNYDLKPGDIITAFVDAAVYGPFTKTLEVSNVMITELDLEADIVYGIAEPEQSLEALAFDGFGWYWRYVTADIEGNWFADFSVPCMQEGDDFTIDLRHGIWIDSLVPDDDGDATLYGFNIDNSDEFLPWTQVNNDGFGNSENMQIPSLATFKGYLYAGVWQLHDGHEYAEVWRTNGTSWQMVDHRDTNACAAMIEFKGYLYCGSWKFGDDQGKIWRTADGQNWIEDVNYSSNEINTFKVFNNILFASTWGSEGVGNDIWFSKDGVNWNLSISGGFGDPANLGAPASDIFHGKLYWGTYNIDTGGQIWRTDGNNYELVMEGGFGNSENSGVTALATFDGYLYATTSDSISIEVWRSADGENWDKAFDLQMYAYPLGDDLINGMEVFDGYLYIVIQNDMTGLEVWRTATGTEWIQVSFGGFEDNNNGWSYWDNAITSYKGQLYIGTNNFETGGEVWTFLTIE